MSEGLTAEEMQALREALASGRVDLGAPQRRGRVRQYDFRVPDKFSKDQMRALIHLHDGMSRTLTTTLSAHLRRTAQIETPTLEQMTYQSFITQLPDPTVISVVQLAPWEGSALVQLDTSLAFPMIDRLLGGPGAALALDRALTDIESIVIRRVVTLVLDAWCDAWSHVVELKGEISAIEGNPVFVQVAATNDIVLAVSVQAQVGHHGGAIRLCLPFSLLEPVLDLLTSRQWYQRLPRKERPGEREGLVRSLTQVSVPVAVRLGEVRLRVQELLDLEPGDLVPLGVHGGQSVTVMVNGRAKFEGRPGRVGHRLGVEITGRTARGVS